MRYSSVLSVFTMVVIFSFSSAFAAEIVVPPGQATLPQAVIDAADGDTLLLEGSLYAGNILIDKSLTIRGSGATNALLTGTQTINGAGITVTLQGLSFSATVNVQQAGEVRISENHFINGADITSSISNAGNFFIIGNDFDTGSNLTASGNSAYIAGNTLTSGAIDLRTAGWVVGNDVSSSVGGFGIRVIANSGAVQILANRVVLNSQFGAIAGIDIAAADYALISGNIIQINDHSSGNRIYYGIRTATSTLARILNNNIDRIGTVKPADNRSRGIKTSSEAIANIVTGFSGTGFQPIEGLNTAYNLCFDNNSSTCGDNAVLADPLFIDHIDYQLAIGSPAIDTGADSNFSADLDRTRNDIGAHGGPWAIDQYDAQRDPAYTGPFIYPLFDANNSVVNGSLRVHALGIARVR